MARIALCIIATNNYIDFVPPLLESADKYFLEGHEVVYHVFTNEPRVSKMVQNVNRGICAHALMHEPWPAMTLKRYEIMSSVDLSSYDYCYYVDSDMLFVAPVGDEIFGELVAVQHPGFYRGGGSWETDPKSTAYIPPAYRLKYVCGGMQGGSGYFNACIDLKKSVDIDTENGVTAVWNDESHWNRYYAQNVHLFKTLTPDYTMVQEPEKRKAWGIGQFEPKIIALAKDHSKYQK